MTALNRPPKIKEYFDDDNVKLITFRDFAQVNLDVAKPGRARKIWENTDLDKWALHMEGAAGAFAAIGRRVGEGRQNKIILPSRYFKERRWEHFAVAAHEKEHTKQFDRNPAWLDRFYSPLPGFLGSLIAAGQGIGSLIASAAGGSTVAGGSIVKKGVIGSTAAFAAFGLSAATFSYAIETQANISAYRELKKLGAPSHAYDPIRYSQMAYTGNFGQAIGLSTFGVGLAAGSWKGGLAAVAGGAIFTASTVLNSKSAKNFQESVNRSEEFYTKHGSNNKPLNKTVGHHPGRANKQTETAIDSDFSAGHSVLPWSAVFKAEKVFSKISPAVNTKLKLGSHPTAGLVNSALHSRKTNHTIMDPVEKTKHLFKAG